MTGVKQGHDGDGSRLTDHLVPPKFTYADLKSTCSAYNCQSHLERRGKNNILLPPATYRFLSTTAQSGCVYLYWKEAKELQGAQEPQVAAPGLSRYQ